MICEWKINNTGQYFIEGIVSPREVDRPDPLRAVTSRSMGVVTAIKS
jgi:hypothetical protein